VAWKKPDGKGFTSKAYEREKKESLDSLSFLDEASSIS